ncbi:two-component system osmolarity sensor histidine kinase EnvZ [Paucimonas lemoignei]|uniref:histidine kinase n=1 Tax=Paucimonas lemoignei TaxID=29443 RepID=A0A4R3I2T4_PAULE|nr:ATP-binding protein [Paucimonas lemoignei]TCS39564.1 two-component system osmolarity sensor histidine kinase EnvZ [Paucimonas lemoignei]
MSNLVKRLPWLKSGLFWRTFILLALLITTSMAAWVYGVRSVERAPRARQIAAQVVSMVTITRAALTHSAPDLRRELLFDLASNEGIRVYPLEDTDVVERYTGGNLAPLVQEQVRAKLGEDTRFARKVNDVEGFWVSFNIDDDAYWLMLDRGRIDRNSGVQWLGWGTVTLLLALIGALFISGFVNLPLARLTAATRAVAKGRQPEKLPEKGPREIREANRSFNQMVSDLERIESDRALILAGISHDLRTPISRMLLEVEMAGLDPEARAGMQADLAQMDAIIGQFLDYARPDDPSSMRLTDLSILLQEIVQDTARLSDVKISAHIDEGLAVMGQATDIKRVFTNLVENARRYARHEDGSPIAIDLQCHRDSNVAVIEFADDGPGVPQEALERLLRPFTRLDVARSQANGAGLGLAIVDRLIKRHHGKLQLDNRSTGGLAIRIELPLAQSPRNAGTATESNAA